MFYRGVHQTGACGPVQAQSAGILTCGPGEVNAMGARVCSWFLGAMLRPYLPRRSPASYTREVPHSSVDLPGGGG